MFPLQRRTAARALLDIAATFAGVFPRALLLQMARGYSNDVFCQAPTVAVLHCADAGPVVDASRFGPSGAWAVPPSTGWKRQKAG